MQKTAVASIINFCTNEARFLRACIEQCRYFSSQIIIPVCDHFFDGEPENRDLLNKIYASFPDCQFIEYPFLPHRISSKISRKIASEHFWHSASRALAYRWVAPEIEKVLFLDADEIAEGEKFSRWLEESRGTQYSVLKLSNYWYFREPRFQADSWEDSIVIANRDSLKLSVLLHRDERNAIYDLLPSPKQCKVVGNGGLPMFHHFSWVRTKEEMIRKVEKWGHRKDRNWTCLVEEEFAGPFKGKDFVHGYTFKECAPPFALSMEPAAELSFGPKDFFSSKAEAMSNVRCLSEEEVLRMLGLKGILERWKDFFNFRE